FPLISEAVTGTKASVGPPWFSRYTVPLAIVLVLLSGIGPVIAWRRATAANLRRNFAAPVAAGVVALVALLALSDAARKPLGVAASSAFQHARDFRLSPGQTARVGGYALTYVKPTAKLEAEKVSLGAVLRVRKGGRDLGTLRPTRGYYPSVGDDKGPVAGIF